MARRMRCGIEFPLTSIPRVPAPGRSEEPASLTTRYLSASLSKCNPEGDDLAILGMYKPGDEGRS